MSISGGIEGGFPCDPFFCRCLIRADYANDNQGEYIYIGQATNYLEDLLSADALILVNGQSHIVYQGGESFAKALEPLFADGFVQVSEFVDGRSSHQSQMPRMILVRVSSQRDKETWRNYG